MPSTTIYSPYSRDVHNAQKGQIHCHSRVSVPDALPARELVTKYAQAGYEFVCITDHDAVENDEITVHKANGGSCIQIPSEEDGEWDADHTLCLGVNEGPSHDWNAEEIFRFVYEKGGVAVVAHPYDYGGRKAGNNWCVKFQPPPAGKGWGRDRKGEEYVLSRQFYYGIETWNPCTHEPNEQADQAFDLWLKGLKREKEHFYAFAADDYEANEDAFDRGWIVVYTRSKQPIKAEILSNIKRGNFVSYERRVVGQDCPQFGHIDVSTDLEGHTIHVSGGWAETLRIHHFKWSADGKPARFPVNTAYNPQEGVKYRCKHRKATIVVELRANGNRAYSQALIIR